jgi:hypothetical protein
MMHDDLNKGSLLVHVRRPASFKLWHFYTGHRRDSPLFQNLDWPTCHNINIEQCGRDKQWCFSLGHTQSRYLEPEDAVAISSLLQRMQKEVHPCHPWYKYKHALGES